MKNNLRIMLTSDGLSNKRLVIEFYKLMEDLGDEIKVCVIPWAAEAEDDFREIHTFVDHIARLLGLRASNITILENNQDIRKMEIMYDLYIVTGGNTYKLLSELQDSMMGPTIYENVMSGKSAYLGVSAGSCIACPDIEFVEEDDPNNVGLTEFNALGLVETYYNPHANTFTDARREELAIKYNGMIFAEDGTACIKRDENNLMIIGG